MIEPHLFPARPSRSRSTLRRFAAHRGGGVAVTFALLLVPLVLAVGAAVDYGNASQAKSALDAAADSAVLAAVRRKALSDNASQVEDVARAQFRSLAARVTGASLGDIDVDVKDKDNVRTATLSYKASVPTRFMGLAGFQTMPVQGGAVGDSGVPNFIDFYLLLDNSPSMGLAATTTDIANLMAATKNLPDHPNCAFACHDVSKGADNRYAFAKEKGITLRIDMVRLATQKLTDAAAEAEVIRNQFRTAIYTFGQSCQDQTIKKVSSLTPNHATARRDADNIKIMELPYDGFNNSQCTDLPKMLDEIKREIPSAGDGSNHANARKVLFLVSDGVTDAPYPSTCTGVNAGARCFEPIRTDVCTELKARGVRIAVLHTSYLRLPDSYAYSAWIEPFAPRIGSQMQACASPDLYFEVSPSQGIPEAMTALFQKAVAQARLTR